MLRIVDRVGNGSGLNIGTGRLTTFLEVAQLFAALDGRQVEVKPLVDRPVGVQSRYCDPSEMKRVLDWEPEISLEDGFGRVLAAAHARVASLGPHAID